MNFVAQVEELLRDLGAESRKKHPGVREASERAMTSLKSLQSQYVSAVRASPLGKDHPSTKLFRSQDVLRPFLLACNYPDANAKLLTIGLNAIQLLINGDAVAPEDSAHIARVLVIQATVGASTLHGEANNSSSSSKHYSTSSLASSLIGTVSAGFSSAVTGVSSNSNTPRSRKEEEAVCIKLLQTLTMVVASRELVLGEDVLSQCIMVCLILIGPATNNNKFLSRKGEGRKKTSVQPLDKHCIRVKRAAVGTLKQVLSLAVDRIGIPPTKTEGNAVSLRQQTRRAVAGAFEDLCALAENRTSSDHRRVAGLPPKSELHGPFSISHQVGTGRHLQYAQMPPRPTCFELINLLICQCPSLFLSENNVNSDDDITNFSNLLRSKACPVATTTLFSEFTTVPNMLEYNSTAGGESKQQQQQEIFDFALLVRCSELASTIVNEFGLEKQLCAECHMLITSLVKFVTEATEGYHQAETGFGFEDGFIYTTNKARKDPDNIPLSDMNNNNAGSSISGSSIRQPCLISNALLWRAALALEAIYKIVQSPALLQYLHISCDAQQLNDTLVPALAGAVSDFATISASNEAGIRSIVFSARRSSLVRSSTRNKYNLETKVIARAREYARFFDEWDCIEPPSGTSHHHPVSSSSGEYATLASLEFSDSNTPVCDEGEVILLSLHCIISLISSIQILVESDHTSDSLGSSIPTSIGGCAEANDEERKPTLKSLVDCVFASCLAALQHYLKRFYGCPIIVEHALYGYEQLANASMPLASSDNVHRKALLASLCKLSLPSWGKASADSSYHPPEKPLQDHHIQALFTLLKILHRNPNHIQHDWIIVLSTLDQLSSCSIASPEVSNDCYRIAESIASVFTRLAEFTTCLKSDSLNYFVDALIDLSTADLQGILPSFVNDEGAPNSPVRSAGGDAGHASKGSSSASLGFFSFAGRALGVGGGMDGSGESSSSLQYEQARVPVSKTYGAGLYASISSGLPEKGNASTQQKDVKSRLPFPLVLLVNTVVLNMHRFAHFGVDVIQHLCDLATFYVQDYVRSFATDTVASLITSRFNSSSDENASIDFPTEEKVPMKNLDDPLNLLALESVLVARKRSREDDVHSDVTVSQQEVISPLCSTIALTIRPEGAEAGLSALYVILENTGHGIEGSMTWSMLIESIAACAGNTSERSGGTWIPCGMLAFRCLKLIVDDFLDVLPEPEESSTGKSTRNALLDCCASFGNSTHDVNTSLTATGMLWTIADRDPCESTLNHVLEKLANLACDTRAEVRNCSVNTLFLCVVGIGNKLSGDQWEACLTGTIFGVLEKVSRFNDAGKENNEGGVTNELANKSSREKRYRVNVHHSRDSAEKQWQATLVLTLRGLERLLRQFFVQLLRTTVDVVQVSDSTNEMFQKIKPSRLGGEFRFESDEGSDEALSRTRSISNVQKNTPWFLDAWDRILAVALKWASTPGGREILDLRLVGVDILVLCSQLASKRGIEAASIAVRVGTNMQVINGALRSVRPSGPLPGDQARQLRLDSQKCTEATEEQRDVMFRVAFDALELFAQNLKADEELNEEENFLLCGGSTTLQVITRLSVGLSKLYECCKMEEFSETFDDSNSDFEARFVTMVRLAATKSLGDANSKYLNQSQRTCLELLKTMSASSSWRAFETLAILGGNSFILKPSEKSAENVEDDDSQVSSQLARELLEIEAAKIVADAFLSENISNLVKASVLSMILGMFQNERDEMESAGDDDESVFDDFRCYNFLVPVIEGGLKAASALEGEHEEKDVNSIQIQNALQETVWERMINSLSYLLSPLNIRGCSSYAPHTAALLKIITSAVEYVPPRAYGDLGAVLSGGAYHAKKVATMNFDRGSLFNPNRVQPDVHCTDALMVFRSCFSGLCCCEPESPELCSIAMSALENYNASKLREDVFFDELPDTVAHNKLRESQKKRSDADGDYGSTCNEKYDVEVELALIVCECITKESPYLRNLFVAVFPLLCKLTVCESNKLRLYAGAALGTFELREDVSEGSQLGLASIERMRGFEKRARDAEERVKELEAELERLKLELIQMRSF